MTRAEVSIAFTSFFDRAVCATVADAELARVYIATLRSYIEALEASFEPLDQWSVLELVRAIEFLRADERWVLGATEALIHMAQASQLIDQHKEFLDRHGLLPAYLSA
jgi:hypothetical protein